MRRRLVLATLAVLAAMALAGCADASGSLSMTPVDDAELADEASQSIGDARHVPELRHERRVTRAIRDGPINVTTGHRLGHLGLPVEYRGAYYNVTAPKVDEVPGYATGIRIDYNDSNPNGTRIEFADLSPAERRKIRPLLATEPPRVERGFDFGMPLFYTESERANSTLADHQGDTLGIRFEGRAYEVEVDRFEERTLGVYRYEATNIADSAQGFADLLKSEYAFTLSNLNENETSVVEEAVDETYYAESTDDPGFASLVERFRSQRAVESDEYSGSWVVRYEGQLYWAEMDYGGFVDETEETVTQPEETPPPQ